MKKGFTITELLAVIIVIGLLAGLSFPIVRKSITSYRNKALKIQENNILMAAKDWCSDNLTKLPDGTVTDNVMAYSTSVDNYNDASILQITYGDLIRLGYIDRSKNPVTRANIQDNDYYIEITFKTTGKWNYELINGKKYE